MKVVIIGGVAGGATAAARIRRLDEHAQITIFERTGYVSYANCGLPYYVGGVITDKQDLTLQTPEGFWRRFRIAAKVHHEVTAINVDRKTVSVTNLDTGEHFEESYDKLIVSPGAKPVIPPVPGATDPRLFTLRTVEDTFRMKDYVTAQLMARKVSAGAAGVAADGAGAATDATAGTTSATASVTQPLSVIIAGGGYIGIEAAENLAEAGAQVTIIQRPKQLMNTLDYDMATLVHAKLRERSIKLVLGGDVTGFEFDGAPATNASAAGAPTPTGVTVHIRDRESLHADMAILAVGVKPDTQLAKDAGLELGIKGSIVVNERMETSTPNVYAVGDAVQITHAITGAPANIALAGPANKQGRIAANNICGIESTYKGALGTSVIKVFDATVASTGLTQKAAQASGLNATSVVLSPASHAGYYPGAKSMTMKVVFEAQTGKLLGAQIVGADGVDKRIDILATAIAAGLNASDLVDLDLAYAPPYSSAKDPVNMAGYMIENIERGLVKQFHWDDVSLLPRDGSVTLLDSRTPGEYARGHASDFVNIPLDEIRERISEIPAGKTVYVMCQSGLRSYLACRILTQAGFDCYNFSGGYRFYAAVTGEQALSECSYPCGMDK